MKFAILFLATLIWAEEPKKPEPTIADLQKQLAETKDTLDKTSKLLREYYDKYRTCDEAFTQLKALGPPPQAKQ